MNGDDETVLTIMDFEDGKYDGLFDYRTVASYQEIMIENLLTIYHCFALMML